MGIFKKAKAKIIADVKEVEQLLYTPVANHPQLEKLREIILAEVQSHLATGNAVLKEVETMLATLSAATLAPVVPAAPMVPAVPAAK